MNEGIHTITDPTGERWQADVKRIEIDGPKPAQPAGVIDVQWGTGDDAEALQTALDLSAEFVAVQFNQLNIEVAGKVPSGDWAKAEQATGRTVRLPSAPLVINRPVYMLSHTPLVGHSGAGLFDSSKIFFEGEGCLIVCGDINLFSGEFIRSHGSTISGVYFVGGEVILAGSISNLRISNCHFNLGTSRTTKIPIRHEPSRLDGGLLGSLRLEQAHLKEVMISDNQFEGGLRGVDLRHPYRCRVQDNEFLYQEVGVVATGAEQLRVTGNTFTRDKGGNKPYGYAGVIQGEQILLDGNIITGLERGGWVEDKHPDALGDHMGKFDGIRSHEHIYTSANPKTTKLPRSAGGFEEGYSIREEGGGDKGLKGRIRFR